MAISPWAQLEQQANTAQNTPPPVFATMPMSSQAPEMAPAQPPAVSRIPTSGEQQLEDTQNQLQKVHWQQANPWGTPENHPGKLGKIAHVFSNIGNIAGDIFAPDVMAHIPGTQMNREVKENELTHRLEQENQEQSLENERAATQAETEEKTREAPGKAQSEEDLQGAETAEKTAAVQNPPLAVGYAHAVNQAIKEGRDPATDPIVQHIQDAITGLQKQTTTPPGTKTVQLEKGGRPHQVLIDERTGKEVQDLGESGEKPPTVNVNAGISALDHETARLAKPYEKGISDATTQLEKIADAKAMINGSAEAQALGLPKVLTALVSGQGSGVRITQAELNSIGKARGLSGDVEGTLNSWAGKGRLTGTQQQQLSGILDDVQRRIAQKQQIHSDALDRINGAGSREEAIKADKEARQKLTQPAEETREYQGHTYEKGADGQWHLQQKKQ